VSDLGALIQFQPRPGMPNAAAAAQALGPPMGMPAAPMPIPPAPAKDKPAHKKRKPMDDDAVLAIVGRELGNAIGQDGDELSKARAYALDLYEGLKPDPPDADGRSSVVMRSVFEAIEWLLPLLLRIFVASDKIAIIEPTKPGEAEDEAASMATTYLTQIFYKDNDGFSLLLDWFKDGLLQRLGWVKRYWQEKLVQTTESYTGLTREQYDALLNPPEGEVEAIDEEERTEIGPMGPVTVYDCTLQTTLEESRIVLENVPPEEVLYSPRSRRGYLPFVCHRRARTVSDLLEDGYDEDGVLAAVGDAEGTYSDEAARRQRPESSDPFEDDRTDEAMREVYVEESYILLDYNRDGIAELCKVTTANGASRVLLTRDDKPDIEAVDEIPLVHLCPVPMPHKLAGHSIADMCEDLQRIKSALMRQILDNLYLTNNPRTVVEDGAANENTHEDILRSRPGGLIRARQAAGIVPHTTPFAAGAAFPMLEYVDTTQEIRTGISRHSQGLDPNVMNKSAASTASGINMLQQAAAVRVELIARIFGRSVQQLVEGILGLVRRHQQQSRVIMVTGKPLTMDPSQWRSQLDVNVSVGLGTGSRDQILAHLMQILQLQAGIVQQQGGVTGPLVYAQNVFDALEKLTENAGFKESFFANPSEGPPPGTPPPGPEKPDPEMAKAQAAMQLQDKKAQSDAQLAMQKFGLEERLANEKAAREAELAQQEQMHRLRLEQQDANNRLELERDKMRNELMVETARLQMQERVELERIARQPAEPPGANGGGEARP